MRIETYFQELQTVIDACPFVDAQQVTFDKRGATLGFIRGDLIMIDGSKLHFREFVDTQTQIDRVIYAYHYMSPDNLFRFRYDNVDHHRELDLSTHPHHKHLEREDHIVVSHAPDLADVLIEIELLVQLP